MNWREERTKDQFGSVTILLPKRDIATDRRIETFTLHGPRLEAPPEDECHFDAFFSRCSACGAAEDAKPANLPDACCLETISEIYVRRSVRSLDIH